MLKLITEAESDAGVQTTSVGTTLDDLARTGAQRMIEAALRVEVEDYLARFRGDRDEAGHALVVRNGAARPGRC